MPAGPEEVSHPGGLDSARLFDRAPRRHRRASAAADGKTRTDGPSGPARRYTAVVPDQRPRHPPPPLTEDVKAVPVGRLGTVAAHYRRYRTAPPPKRWTRCCPDR